MNGFQSLQKRLLEHLRERVHNGETTERRMAHLIGLSQPHLHNILKGVRGLNSDIADAILQKLGLTLLELFNDNELQASLAARRWNSHMTTEIPVLFDRLGPGLPFPEQTSPFERVSIPCRALTAMRKPLVARLSQDPRMAPLLTAGDLVLLDHSDEARIELDSRSLFVISQEGTGVVRWVRMGARGIYVISEDCRDRPLEWTVLPAARVLDYVAAKVTPVRWLSVPDPVPVRRQPRGTSRAPEGRSVAS